jgi:hypothetical protein
MKQAAGKSTLVNGRGAEAQAEPVVAFPSSAGKKSACTPHQPYHVLNLHILMCKVSDGICCTPCGSSAARLRLGDRCQAVLFEKTHKSLQGSLLGNASLIVWLDCQQAKDEACLFF